MPQIAQRFGVSTDELPGTCGTDKAGKHGPPLVQRQIERLNRLPKAQQKVVLKMLEGVLSQPGRRSNAYYCASFARHRSPLGDQVHERTG